MLTKKRIPLLMAIIFCIEASVLLWAYFTSTLQLTNFFGIEPQFIFDKCARNAGRISAALILILLCMIGYFGLKKIYENENKRNSFLILMTLFSFNHLIHLLFVFLLFRAHTEPLSIVENLHGFITFIFIVAVPFILWSFQKLNKLLYFSIIIYLFNICYFMNKTFLGKIKPPEHPAYHNQLGIVLLTAGCIYILYRVFKETQQQKNR